MSKPPACLSCGTPALPGWTNIMPVTADTYLCHSCVEAMLGYFEARASPITAAAPKTHGIAIPTPAELIQALDHEVIGQHTAKQLLAVAAWKHMQRCAGNAAAPRAHVLLYGPTGCGKTHLARTAAKLMDVPFITVDATTFSETGYKGRDVRDIVLDVLDVADGNTEKAHHAVVFVDEFDKLSAAGGETRMAYQHGTQHGFLTLLEGAPVTVERNRDFINFDPSGLLFIFAGAFSDLEDIISTRLNYSAKQPIGFGCAPRVNVPEASTLLGQAMPADFVHYGLEAELIGRIPVLAPILPLSMEELVRVLIETEGSVYAQYAAFFSTLGTEFSLSSDAAQLLAQEAKSSGSGARGLRGRLERVITQLLFDLPAGSAIHITPQTLQREMTRHDTVSST